MGTQRKAGRSPRAAARAPGGGPRRGVRGRNDWDGCWKRLLEQFSSESLALVCTVSVDDARPEDLPTERQRPMMPDKVFRVTHHDGTEQIVHVEIQTQAESGFELRLATYFTLLAARYGSPPHQVVIMPNGGTYSGRYRYGRMRLDYDVVDITTLDPAPLLASPLAPLALWSTDEPEVLIEQVVDRIAEVPDLEKQAVLVEVAILKSERVANLIKAALERRNMSNVLESTQLGRELLARGEARGEAKGEARGEIRGRAQALHVMLVERFGDLPELEAIATSLALDDDVAASLKRIRAASFPEELVD